jgi:hypothetical protein
MKDMATDYSTYQVHFPEFKRERTDLARTLRTGKVTQVTLAQ